MTTPNWGQLISLWHVNAEIGNGTNGIDLNWVRNNTKDGVANLNSIHDRAWYQRNVDGNCNNGNCNCSNCNCGQANCPASNCACDCNCTAINCTPANCIPAACSAMRC